MALTIEHLCNLVWVEGKALGGADPLSHEAVVVTDVVQHLLRLNVVDPDGLLGRRAGEGEGGTLPLATLHLSGASSITN